MVRRRIWNRQTLRDKKKNIRTGEAQGYFLIVVVAVNARGLSLWRGKKISRK
jgi:hypothetical protein